MALFGFASNALAVASLEVLFTPDPLFSEANFLPLDETFGTVKVTNNSGVEKTILTEAINVFDNDNFSSLLHLNISGGTPYDDSLADFFGTAGEVPLGLIANGESKIFTYTISFIDSSNNSYQGKTLGFDICVGFQGDTTTHCGDTVVGGENDTGGGGGGGGGGSSGGGGGGPIILTISNEQTASIVEVGGLPPTSTATITWRTNLLATSQVVYGPTPPTYSLDMGAVFFGYPMGTTEDPTKVLNHSMSLTGIIPGQTYLYRVVSRASPPTVSFEHQFTVPTAGTASIFAQAPGGSNFTGGNPPSNTGGSGAGNLSTGAGLSSAGTEGGTPELEANVIDAGNNLLTANAFLSGFRGVWSTCSLLALLVLIVVYLIWALWLRKKYEKGLVPEKEIQDRFYLFFGGFSLLVALVAVALREYCSLPVFLISIVICICIYAYRKFVG